MGKCSEDHRRQGAKHEEVRRYNTMGYTCGFDKCSVGKKAPRDCELCRRV